MAETKSLYLIEYYQRNRKTGETGWDINFAWVDAKDSTEAREKVAKAPYFDVVITCSEAIEIVPLAGVTRPVRIY